MMQMMPSNTLEIAIDGNLLGASALALPGRMPLAELASADHVVLSMHDVDDADAAGVAFVVRLYSQLRVRGTTLNLVGVQRRLAELLKRIGLDRLLVPAPTAEPRARRYQVVMPTVMEA